MAIANGTQFSLDAFISKNRDFARGYTFYITIANQPGDTVDSEQQKYLVRTASLPVATITPSEVNWQGNVYRIGTTQEFTDFTVSYSVDVKDEIRYKYEKWMTIIHNPENNEHGAINAQGGYMADIELEHLSHRTGKPIMKYKLHMAWPSNIGEVTLDYSSKEVAMFDVTFTYQYHTYEHIPGNSGS